MHRLYTTLFRGLAPMGREEIAELFGVPEAKIEYHYTRNHDLLFFHTEDPKSISMLRCAEDVYCQVTDVRLRGEKSDFKEMSAALASKSFRGALELHHQLRQHKTKVVSFSVIVQAPDVSWRDYRRVDLQRAVEKALLSQNPHWKLVGENAAIEIWIQQIERDAVIGVRLTDNESRKHGYKYADLPGSLRPSIAAAMVRMSAPQEDDIVLDPMCGAGTLLLERAISGRYQMLWGGDQSPEAVKTALENFGPRHKPREIKQWSAAHLPLEDQSVDVILTNPPWGRQMEEEQKLGDLYYSVLQECHRVIKPGGRMVMITSQWRFLREAAKLSGWKVVRQLKNINVLGWHADIFKLIPTSR